MTLNPTEANLYFWENCTSAGDEPVNANTATKSSILWTRKPHHKRSNKVIMANQYSTHQKRSISQALHHDREEPATKAHQILSSSCWTNIVSTKTARSINSGQQDHIKVQRLFQSPMSRSAFTPRWSYMTSSQPSENIVVTRQTSKQPLYFDILSTMVQFHEPEHNAIAGMGASAGVVT